MADPCPLAIVGTARTARLSPESTPVQSALNLGEEGEVEVQEQYVEGLAGLAGFDYIWLLTWLGRPGGTGGPGEEPVSLTQVPFLLRPQGRSMGVLATRGPRRINPIGLSLVRLIAVDGATLRFAGVDLVDGTPVIDIKPYVTRFDRPPGEPACGWFDDVPMPDGVTPADLNQRT